VAILLIFNGQTCGCGAWRPMGKTCFSARKNVWR